MAMIQHKTHIAAIKALCDYNSKFSKFMNLIMSDYKLLKLEEALEKFTSASEEYKIQKIFVKQIECLLKIDEIYDKKFLLTKERLDKKFQCQNLKLIIDSMLKENKKNIIIGEITNFTPYDVLSYVKKFITISEETAEDEHLLKSIEYIQKLYENVQDEKIIEYLGELYEKQFELTEKYSEKYGDLLALHEKYKKAGEVYESIGKINIESSTLKFTCGRLFLKSITCYILEGDEVYAKRKFLQFELEYPIIEADRDFKFTKKIMESYLEKDIETFTNIMVEYDSISKLTDFYVGLFNKIKKNMSQDEELDLC